MTQAHVRLMCAGKVPRSSNGALWGPKRATGARVEMALAVARGMAAMEGAQPPLLHRDLKPANVFIGVHPSPQRLPWLGHSTRRSHLFSFAKACTPPARLYCNGLCACAHMLLSTRGPGHAWRLHHAIHRGSTRVLSGHRFTAVTVTWCVGGW